VTTTEPPPPVTTSIPPPPPPAPAAPKYPPAGALGEGCRVKNSIGTAPDGTLYYCSRLQYTDGYQWSLTPGDIPNPVIKPYTPAPAADIDPLGPSPMDRCTNPGAITRGTLGLMECNEFLPGSGWFVWGVRPR
jgi:serine/threonine-protein kinase